ncbi:hypothetical protein ASPVEDRAFT_89100 [Aspergillus versicolor CBS 583.65]|uniref:Uncharacterized protein n=1 Tax=Aspergillus versicolor CBS 583.65 TaxID=1036611 RepID=A0A1L9Q2A7_ASPVE|nr:uncharacterized protein ASPVEDRAFT_89100 [Aspergillus versicolor CBS 583.65]OJJ07869.1 hypothetical protein ASPVEDRAFT_89100 [Aspergillus versicolor CBS 583.65]
MSSKTARFSMADWKAWKLELCALVGALLSFAIMVIVLGIFDGRPIFDWKNVTLNAIISVLSVAMKASLTFAIAELIGQWKWILFSRAERPLTDFERIDMASRGPWGSLRVLSRMHGFQVLPLQLGALLIVLVLALDPFSQQLIQLEQRPSYGEPSWHTTPGASFTTLATSFDQGKALYAHDWSRAENSTRNPVIRMTTELELPMQAAILAGLSRSRKTIDQQSTVQCPTGICTWDQFQTLGVCHRCQDLTPELKRVDDFGEVYNSLYNDGHGDVYQKENGTAFSLPNGHFLMNMNGCSLTDSTCDYLSPAIGHAPPSQLTMSSFGTGDPSKTNSMRDINTLIWSMSVIHLDSAEIESSPKEDYEYEWPDIPLLATECAMYYCVKSISLTVEDNIIHENVKEATDAVRDPNSWLLSSSSYDSLAPENIPPVNESATLEFNELYAYAGRSDLVLYFPDNSTKPTYSITDDAVWALSHRMQDLLSTNITTGANMTSAMLDLLPEDAVGYNGVIQDQQSIPAAVGSVWNEDKLNIEETFGTLATSITNGMREEYDGYAVDYVYGHTGTPTQYYKAQWGWIALHCLVLIGAALFMLVTARNSTSSQSVPVWKNSPLATISGGSSAVDILRGAETIGELEKKAREKSVMIPVGSASTSYQRIRQNEESNGSST